MIQNWIMFYWAEKNKPSLVTGAKFRELVHLINLSSEGHSHNFKGEETTHL